MKGNYDIKKGSHIWQQKMRDEKRKIETVKPLPPQNKVAIKAKLKALKKLKNK